MRERALVRTCVVSLLSLAVPLSVGLAPLPARAADDASAADDPVFEFTVTDREPVTASSTLTVPAEDFELRPLESGGQMLEAVPGGITAQHTGGGKAEQYFFRGFDADHGTDVLVYFDGVPINLRSHAHGQGFLDLHFVTKETIERLDAHKGPYSARYGDFTTAAAIEYVPFESRPESMVRFEGGEFDTERWVGVVSPRFGAFAGSDAPADAMVSFEAYHTDGPYRDDENLWRFSSLAKGGVDLSPALRLSGHALGYYGDWNASGLVPERLVDADLLSRFGSLDPTEGGNSTRVQGKLQLDWQPSERRHLMANAYVAYYDLDLYSNFTYALNDPVNGDGIVQRDDRIYAGGRIEHTELLALSMPTLFRGGLEWRYDDAHVRLGNQTRRSFTGSISDDEVQELSLAPYLETEILPLSWVRFVGGLRFEVFRYQVRDQLGVNPDVDENDRLWLPKANLVLSPFGAGGPLEAETGWLRRLELFLNYGAGFHSNDARSAVDEPHILARANGAEVGLRTRIFDRVDVAVDAFWLELEDELVFVGDEGTTESSGRTRRLGVELVAVADVTDWLYLRGDLAYVEARITRGDLPVPQAPRFVGKGAVGVRHAGFAAELGVRHLGERYGTESFGDPRLTDYTVVDLGVRYRHGPFEVGLAVENITDEEWRSSEFFYGSCAPNDIGPCPPDGFEDRHFTAGNPRNVRGSVTVHF